MKADTEEVINLPKSNVLSYSLADGGAVIVRPSGTEPKIKLYLTSVGKTREESLALCDKLGNGYGNKIRLIIICLIKIKLINSHRFYTVAVFAYRNDIGD